ncbi:MAG: YfhO family protein [Bacteroidota bacterium]|nr:YfhO family protein [Bacteroidota bacterium]
MKNPVYQKLWPVAAAVVLFLFITLAYFHPLFEGKRLFQSDISHFMGMSKEIVDYRASTGKEPLWTNSMFGGMPAYQISTIHKGNLMTYIDTILQAGLPRPAGFVFLYFIGFFILMMAMGMKPWLSIVGSVAFAFSSFFFIVIVAGHNSEAHAIAYMAPVIASILLAFRKKYLLGGALMALFLSLQINANHLQITYYLALMSLIIGVYYLVVKIREKQLPDFFKALGVLFVGALLAIGPNISNLWTTMEYTSYSTRGQSELTDHAHQKTSGLDRDYATQWSYGVDESLTLLIPNAKGGASDALGNYPSAMAPVKDELKGIIAQNHSSYWGDQPFTSGPVYVGAFIVFLFILGMFIVEDKLKWPLFAVFALSLLLAWGKNFAFMTNLFLDFVPGYAKFRAPTMILVLAELVMPIVAILGLKKIIEQPEILKTKKLYVFISLGLTAGVSLLLYIFPGTFSLISKTDLAAFAAYTKQGAPESVISDLTANLELARKTILSADAIRSFLFVMIGAGLLWLYMKKLIKANLLIVLVTLLIMIDIIPVDSRYLGVKNYDRKTVVENPFPATMADELILKDKDPDFRVANVAANTYQDASTSYYHKSIGGYHAAKLKRYDELIQYQLSKGNMEVFNMLNTKYIIVPDSASGGIPKLNSNALGNAWFVRGYKIVPNADAEMNSLSSFKAKETAIIDSRFENQLQNFKFSNDTTGTIQLKKYAPNDLVYESKSKTDQLAVFSEIYYAKGWNASIDGKPAPYLRANYVLRAMVVPAGNHTIEYKFEPRSYILGTKLSLASSILLLLLLAGVFGTEIRKEYQAAIEKKKA